MSRPRRTLARSFGSDMYCSTKLSHRTYAERLIETRPTIRGGARRKPAAPSYRKRSFAIHADRLRPSRRPTARSRWTCSADALRAAGVDEGNLYHDLAAGVRDDRPGLDSCLRALRNDDVLVVWKLDRLGRNLAHLVNTVQDLSAPGVGLRVLAGQGAQIDTTTAAGRLVFGIFAALRRRCRLHVPHRRPEPERPDPLECCSETRTRGAKAPLSSRLPMPGRGALVSGLEAEVEAVAPTRSNPPCRFGFIGWVHRGRAPVPA